jgi:hypothetical protein
MAVIKSRVPMCAPELGVRPDTKGRLAPNPSHPPALYDALYRPDLPPLYLVFLLYLFPSNQKTFLQALQIIFPPSCRYARLVSQRFDLPPSCGLRAAASHHATPRGGPAPPAVFELGAKLAFGLELLIQQGMNSPLRAAAARPGGIPTASPASSSPVVGATAPNVNAADASARPDITPTASAAGSGPAATAVANTTAATAPAAAAAAAAVAQSAASAHAAQAQASAGATTNAAAVAGATQAARAQATAEAVAVGPRWDRFRASLAERGYFRGELAGSHLHSELLARAKMAFCTEGEAHRAGWAGDGVGSGVGTGVSGRAGGRIGDGGGGLGWDGGFQGGEGGPGRFGWVESVAAEAAAMLIERAVVLPTHDEIRKVRTG